MIRKIFHSAVVVVVVIVLGSVATLAQMGPPAGMGPGKRGSAGPVESKADIMGQKTGSAKKQGDAPSGVSGDREKGRDPATAFSSMGESIADLETPLGPMGHPELSPPFYRERTFLVLVGLVLGGAIFLAFRIVRRRRRVTGGSVEFVREAVLVVDLVNSTHLATHYGNGLAMQTRNMLKVRILEAAGAHEPTFAENTGDGYFMTFPSVMGAVRTASVLLKGLRNHLPDVSAGLPLDIRAGISFGEILLDRGGARHGAVINKAFRLEGLSRESFVPAGNGGEVAEIAERNRIFIDEEAAQELRSNEIPLRFVGFSSLKGFSGLHRVYEVSWDTKE